MKGQIFNPGQPHKKQSFDNAQDSHESAMRERLLDFVSPGIIDDSQTNSESVPFQIDTDTGLQIRVGTGRAFAPHSVSLPESVDASDLTKLGGERILIPAADVSNISGNSYARSAGGGVGTGTGTGPFKESANGLGGWTSTPQSTKTRHIPLTNGSMNYVWLTYLRQVDPTTTALHKVNTSLILYPKKTDGYDIIVTTSSALPGGDPRWLLLGTVDLTTSPGSVTTGMISMANRSYALTRPKRTSIRLDPALSPASYDATIRTIRAEEHVNAFGTGVVTARNPHGMTLADLGFTEDVDLKTHRLKHHSNGLIVPTPTSTTSAMYPREDTSTPKVGDAAMVFMKKLGTDESLLMNGSIFDDTKIDPAYKLTAPIGSGSIGDYYVSFGTSHPAGVYGIVAKQSGTLVQFEKRISPFSFNAEAEFLVATVQWSGTAFISPAPPGVQTDERLFGSISNRNLQANAVATGNVQDLAIISSKLSTDSVTTVKIVDLNVTTGKLADQSVTTVKLADANVTTPKLGDSAVTSQKVAIWDGVPGNNAASGAGIKTAHLSDASVTAAKIAPGAIPAAAPSIRFFIQGPAVKTDGSLPLKAIVCVIAERTFKIDRFYMFSDTAPVGADLTINLRRLSFGSTAAQNTATTLFPTAKPFITAGSNKAAQSGLGYFDASNNADINNGGSGIVINQGDRLYLDISSVGSTTAGGDDLYITIVGS